MDANYKLNVTPSILIRVKVRVSAVSTDDGTVVALTSKVVHETSVTGTRLQVLPQSRADDFIFSRFLIVQRTS